MTPDEARLRRTKEALRVFAEQPNVFAPEIRDAILAGRVIKGMTPYDVHLAVGAFCFRVMADPKVWTEGANPWDVMWAQTQHPDQSEILLLFDSACQQPEAGMQRFQVFIRGGKALSVEHVPGRQVMAAAHDDAELAATAAWLAAAEAEVGAATIQQPGNAQPADADITVIRAATAFFDGDDATVIQQAFTPEQFAKAASELAQKNSAAPAAAVVPAAAGFDADATVKQTAVKAWPT
jgi:hypothetical protein